MSRSVFRLCTLNRLEGFYSLQRRVPSNCTNEHTIYGELRLFQRLKTAKTALFIVQNDEDFLLQIICSFLRPQMGQKWLGLIESDKQKDRAGKGPNTRRAHFPAISRGGTENRQVHLYRVFVVWQRQGKRRCFHHCPPCSERPRAAGITRLPTPAASLTTGGRDGILYIYHPLAVGKRGHFE